MKQWFRDDDHRMQSGHLRFWTKVEEALMIYIGPFYDGTTWWVMSILQMYTAFITKFGMADLSFSMPLSYAYINFFLFEEL